MTDIDYKLEAPEHDPQPTPEPIAVAPVQTVTFTVTRPDTATGTVEVDLKPGETLADKRLIVALVGASHDGGAFNPQHIAVNVPAAEVASLAVAASKVE